jgi:hypothetical protein
VTLPSALIGRRSALIALASTFLLTVLFVATLIFWLIGSANEEASENLADLARFRAETAARPQVERALAALRAQAANLPIFVHGESDALAQASLQSDIKSIVERAGGEVRSAFALPPTSEQGLDLISVQYDVTVPATKLHELTYAIETHLPYLFITAADVTAPRTWPTDPKAPEPQLEMRWTVSAYRWSGAL